MTAGPRTAVDPCPTELELELAADGRLVFVSDVHLTGGGPVADFGAAGELVELVDGLGRHDGEVLLVLGGDILDLLQAGGPPAEAVDRILGAGDAEAVARALREAAGRPRVRVVYLVGNHDAALAWHGAARRRVAEAFGVTAVALRARITCGARTARRSPCWPSTATPSTSTTGTPTRSTRWTPPPATTSCRRW